MLNTGLCDLRGQLEELRADPEVVVREGVKLSLSLMDEMTTSR